MTNFKFKIGDKIVRNGIDPSIGYDFNDMSSVTKKGDMFTITSRGYAGNGGKIYSVEGAYLRVPNWHFMEKTFDLVKLSWKEKMTK